MSRFSAGQTLLIDADDTLWENNIYFERAIAAFISFLDHHEYSPAEVRQTLNAVERETILAHGYGLTSFTRSLVDCFERLSSAPVTEEKRDAHSRICARRSPSRRSSCCPASPKPSPSFPRATISS